MLFEPDEDQIKLERNKARELRKSPWWKNRIARGVCHYCQQEVPPAELTLDHVVPVARGGRTTKGNCVPCCKACNNQKQSLTPVEWGEFIDRLAKE
ncbi:MAG: HNH endonuclease [Desulfuromonadales bacterium]|nr:HNH endonuclease [Desulfuromonadales bacterium]